MLKALQSLRENINEPSICMHLLTLYNNIASALTPEDIGNKILPGLIPMLISASFTKKQFKMLITTIRTLIDELEKHRLKDLSEIDPMSNMAEAENKGTDIFAGFSNIGDPSSALPSASADDDFDFLRQIEGTSNKNNPIATNVTGSGSTPKLAGDTSDPFSGFNAPSSFPPPPVPTPSKPASDIFLGIGSNKGSSIPQPKAAPMTLSNKKPVGSFDPFDTSNTNSIKPLGGPGVSRSSDVFGDMDTFSTSKPKPSNDIFGASSGSATTQRPSFHPVQDAMGISTPTINMSSGFKSLREGHDPFADIMTEESKAEPKPQTFDSGIKLSMNSASSGFNYGGSSGAFGTPQPSKPTNSSFTQPQRQPTSGISQPPRQSSTVSSSSTSSFSSSKATYGSASDPFSSFGSSSGLDFGDSFSGSTTSTKPATTFQSPSTGFNTGTSSSSFSGSQNWSFGASPTKPAPAAPTSSTSFAAPSSYGGGSGGFGAPSFTGSSSFGSSPASSQPYPSFQMPTGIDMNAPMDQNTMQLMMGMMSNLQQQMNSGVPPASTQSPWGTSQSSASKNTGFGGSSGKGLFD